MEEITPSVGHAGYLERRRALRKQKQEADLLCAQIYDLTDQLLDVRFERDWWLNIAVDAQKATKWH